ncbi:MAG: response regulator, partial [Caldilineaceae bacterium]|nr:response regulator [Caldilineaceae bacterium]
MQSNVTGLARGKILVVDDIPSNLKLLFRILETEGYSAIGTVNAQQALDILAKEREIDLILLDVMLPDM